MKTRLLAIYLPQFHTIPENDAWWGTGFTEWTNVRRGHPFYPGHYQPREPLDDDYYDLSDLKVLERHAREARKAGIYGFCFYHYYFQGKTLLERPIEQYRDISGADLPYCLIWANQSWSRTWYRAGLGKEVMLKQSYGKEQDWEDHFYHLLRFFKDRRYIKVGNRPVYIIYLPQDIHCRGRMFAHWQRLAKDNGFDGLYLIAMNTGYGKDQNHRLYSGTMDLEPLCSFHEDRSWRRGVQDWKAAHIDRMRPGRCSSWNRVWSKNAFSYPYLCRSIEKRSEKAAVNAFPGVFAGWDNSPRKDEEGVIVAGSTPQRFYSHLCRMMSIAEKGQKQFVFLNAWNEWSEGAYIEPDKRYGWGYLNAVKKALRRQETVRDGKCKV